MAKTTIPVELSSTPGITDNSNATAITIDSSENVGIGTSSPGYQLHIAGGGDFLVEDTGNGSAHIRLRSSSGGTASSNWKLKTSNNNFFYIDNDTGSAGNAITIDNDGNVGINMTPAVVGSDTVLSLYDSDSPRIKLHNSTSGTASGDGAELNTYQSDFIIENREAGNVRFFNNGSERMRIDSSGRVGIGTTSPTAPLYVQGNAVVTGNIISTGDTNIIYDSDDDCIFSRANGNETMRLHASGCVGIGSTADRSIGTNITTTVINGSVGGGLWLSGSDSSATTSLIYSFVNGSVGRLVINQGKGVGGGDIDFTFNESASPKVRFTTGHLHFGGHTSEATGSTGGITMSQDGNNRMNLICATTGTGSLELVEFRNPNGSVGDIKTNGSSTSYNTSSDYRLKENVQYTWDATTRLKQLKPARFNFKADADTTLDGFLAHEVQDIVPEAVSGEKDGEKMQGIDQSKLVPLLVKTIQELEARITELEDG